MTAEKKTPEYAQFEELATSYIDSKNYRKKELQEKGLFGIRNYRVLKKILSKSRDFSPASLSLVTKNEDIMAKKFGYLTQTPAEVSDGLSHQLVRPCSKPNPITTDLSRETWNDWETPRESLEIYKKIGCGMFGDVWKGKWQGQTEVAIKTRKPGAMDNKAILAEAQIMKQCRHEKLVTLYAVCSQEEPIFIITELMVNGDLLSYLQGGQGKHLKLQHLVDMSAQIASGMAYLEYNNFIHRNLTARSILVGENNVVKVANFGMARVIEDGMCQAEQGFKFPIKWTAPEAALYGKFTIKSDVWSYGILLVEIINRGQTPYPDMNNREVLERVDRDYRMSKPAHCPDPIYATMIKCWDKRAANRPTFEFLFYFFDDYFVSTEPSHKETDDM